MYAIFETGGKQYKAVKDEFVFVEKLDKEVSDKVEFDALLYADGKKVTVGTPTVKGVKIIAEVVKQGKGAKVIVFKYKPKKDSKKKQGHRQPFTQLKIVAIEKATKAAKTEEVKAEA